MHWQTGNFSKPARPLAAAGFFFAFVGFFLFSLCWLLCRRWQMHAAPCAFFRGCRGSAKAHRGLPSGNLTTLRRTGQLNAGSVLLVPLVPLISIFWQKVLPAQMQLAPAALFSIAKPIATGLRWWPPAMGWPTGLHLQGSAVCVLVWPSCWRMAPRTASTGPSAAGPLPAETMPSTAHAPANLLEFMHPCKRNAPTGSRTQTA